MIRIGMLTPSSNTALEPVTAALLAGVEGVSAHFSRFRVTRIALSDDADAQFQDAPMLAAADLLADAKVDAIAWNGTSASWLGFHRDEALRDALAARTGARACTAVLGFRDALRRLGARKVGLVTPYTADVQARIEAVWAGEGFEVIAERHEGLSDNFSFAEVSPARIDAMVRAVAPGADAVVIVCTNMVGAPLAPKLEADLGVPVLDSVAVTLWAALDALGAPLAPFAAHGRLFADPRLA